MSTQTPNLSLNKPAEGDTDWAAEVNANWDTLDDAVGNCWVEIGSYTGDGSTGQAISLSDASLVIKMLWIFRRPAGEDDTPTYVKFAASWGDYSAQWGSGFTKMFLDNRVNSVGTGTFTVDDDGGDSHPNKNGDTYDYLVVGTH